MGKNWDYDYVHETPPLSLTLLHEKLGQVVVMRCPDILQRTIRQQLCATINGVIFVLCLHLFPRRVALGF